LRAPATGVPRECHAEVMPDHPHHNYEVLDSFERFSQVDDVFSRSRWDPEIRSDASDRFYSTYRRPLTDWRAAAGFTQHDYALRNAAWHVTDIFAEMYEDGDRRDGFLDPLSMLRDGASERIVFDTPEQASEDVKHVAKTVGADLVGIAPYDERWVYTERFSVQTGGGKPNDLPDGMTHVVVIGQSMDHDLTRTAPSALAGTATGLGYSLDSVVLLTIAQYIRNLGYQAIPSMNDTALAIPYALEAGLGEYGRHGLLITPEFGPRLRLGKIFTDMPLARDHPKSFGVERFCEGCRRCTDACPAKAISGGIPSTERYNRSNITGVKKWSVDGVRCFSYWSKVNTDCSVCIRVCPYNRDYSNRASRWWVKLAARSPRLALKVADRREHGKRLLPKHWWPGGHL
jgi:epoxyqueuosine reductase